MLCASCGGTVHGGENVTPSLLIIRICKLGCNKEYQEQWILQEQFQIQNSETLQVSKVLGLQPLLLLILHKKELSKPCFLNLFACILNFVIFAGFISNVFEGKDFTYFNASALPTLGLVPIFFNMFQSDEMIVISNDYLGLVREPIIIRLFKAKVMHDTQSSILNRICDRFKRVLSPEPQ